MRTDIDYRQLDDGAVLYDAVTARVHTLNLTAALIWNFCDGSRSVPEIAAELARDGQLPFEQALIDVSEAISRFDREALLRPR